MAATTPTLYHSSTAPTVGWWVATVPTRSGFRAVKLRRDPARIAAPADILADAAVLVPEVAGWHEEYRLADGRAGFWTGEAAS